MRPLLSLVLALLLALSAAGHGAVRLDGSAGTPVILCTGDGAVTVLLGPDGTPRPAPPHPCPDCLPLAALSAVAVTPSAARPRGALRITRIAGHPATVAPVPRHPPARAPPVPPVA